MSAPSDISPHRVKLWWAVAVVVAVALTVFVCAAVQLRRTANVLGRAALDVALPAAVIAFAAAVSSYVSATRSVRAFESITPSPLLLWAPAVASLAKLV